MPFGRPTLEEAARFSWNVLLIAAVAALGAFIVAQLAMIFLAVFVALLATALLWPVVRFLVRHRWPRILAAFLTVLVSVLSLSGAVAWIVPAAVAEVRENGQELVRALDDAVRSITARLPGRTADLSEVGSRIGGLLADDSRRIASRVATGLVTVGEFVVGMLLAVVLCFFFLKDGDRLVRKGLRELAPARRAVVEAAAARAWTTLGGWLRGAVLVALADAVGIGLGLVIVGVPLALPLALLTFMGGFIPVLGATVAGALAVLVALASGGTTDALIILGVVLAVQQLESNVLEPFVMGRYVPLHPAAILIAVAAGALIAGVTGAFVALPLSAAVAAVLQELRERVPKQPPPPAPSLPPPQPPEPPHAAH
jgi:putative heme transporter